MFLTTLVYNWWGLLSRLPYPIKFNNDFKKEAIVKKCNIILPTPFNNFYNGGLNITTSKFLEWITISPMLLLALLFAGFVIKNI